MKGKVARSKARIYFALPFRNYMINVLRRLLNSNIEPKYVEPIKGDARDTLANIGKAKKIIGYKPKVSLEEGLRKFVEWYKKNPSFYG